MRYAGIIDQNVEPAEVTLDFGDPGAHLVVALNIGLHRHRLHTAPFNLGRKLLGALGRLAIVDANAANPRTCQGPCDRASNTSRAASYQRYSSRQFHLFTLLFSTSVLPAPESWTSHRRH